jgi:desulfoferrodoxin (superoxide reductase-like protein)
VMREKYGKMLKESSLVVCVLLAAVLPVLFPAPGAAHSPKEVVLSYDQAKHTLEVRITHSSMTPSFHYIKKVELKKNGQTISVNEYKSQPDQATFSNVYPVEAARADVIEVKATCNIFGSRTEKLTVP